MDRNEDIPQTPKQTDRAHSRQQKLIGALFVAISAVSWGFSGTIAQYLTQWQGVPVEWLNCVRMLGAADELFDPTDNEINDYIVGETVKVKEDPFNGFTGTIEKVDREKRKLTVMVKIFGRPNPLELENSQVERE